MHSRSRGSGAATSPRARPANYCWEHPKGLSGKALTAAFQAVVSTPLQKLLGHVVVLEACYCLFHDTSAVLLQCGQSPSSDPISAYRGSKTGHAHTHMRLLLPLRPPQGVHLHLPLQLPLLCDHISGVVVLGIT